VQMLSWWKDMRKRKSMNISKNKIRGNKKGGQGPPDLLEMNHWVIQKRNLQYR
jgi:hypothetical protein